MNSQDGKDIVETRTRWEFEQGEEIGPGRIALQRLGGGRRYEAYLAWDEALFTVVVLKLVRPHLTESGTVLSSLKHEAEILASLSHPVIVRLLDEELGGPRPHVVLEHLEGPTLASLIRRYGAVDLVQVLPLAVQVCSGLHYLAGRGLVHLDVKPRNIVMGAPPRLIDFSIACTVAEAQGIKAPTGTESYMSPEQCAPSKGSIAPAADIWGLGVTLYQAVSASLPFPRPENFDDHDLHARFPQLHTDPKILNDNVPKPLADLIFSCLSKNPQDRPSASEVVSALEPLIELLPDRPVLRRMRPSFFR